MRAHLVYTALGVCLSAHAAGQTSVTLGSGPHVLHDDVAILWGGHTFSYVLQGEDYIFWTATHNRTTEGPQDEAFAPYIRRQHNTRLIGQYPLPGTDGVPQVHELTIEGDGLASGSEPLLFRTPDGYLHVIVGTYHYNPQEPTWYLSGRLRYYRSARPEDVSEWIDRTELIPTDPFGEFHLRKNVAVTRDGSRAAIAILAISEDGSIPFNTPVVFLGERDGLDFRFAPAVKYREPLGFFYPQVAALDDDIVLLGEVWDVAERATGRLIHLNWDGQVVREQELPADEADGTYFSYDMCPRGLERWDELLIYHSMSPKDGPWRHQFLSYDVAARQLSALGETPTEYNLSNAGKCVQLGPDAWAFVNNPSMGGLHVWDGDLLAGEPLKRAPIDGANPIGESDAHHQGKGAADRGPCSLLLWRLEASDRG